jgi:putative acyl-CoA dehydrogenase
MPTHEVTNTVPPWPDVNTFRTDGPLTSAGFDPPDVDRLGRLGELAGSAQAAEWGRLANAYPPVLRSHDRSGHRLDEVEFHPAWHELMRVAVDHGLHATPWRDGSHLARAAGFYLWSQVEAGHGCPVSMTYSVVPALRHAPGLTAELEPLLTSTRYDPGLRPPAGKSGLLAGMAMTEKQGGSDVRANTTRAVPAGDQHLLTGHKWFCSAPMCDLFLVLAQAPQGLSCFLVPRVRPDGTRNPFALQRLKDKLGNRSNASAEVEFEGTHAFLVGGAGDGIRTILEMVAMTRLDCVIGSAAGQRAAVVQAVHHARHRRTFGRRLVDAPLMREVLADLITESAASTVLFLRLARAVDDGAAAFIRLAVPAAKFWVTKRTVAVVAEALECLGGNGYVEDSGLPRLYRESPLNSIWEGSGNVIALDVVRAATRDPDSVAAVRAELAITDGADPALDLAVGRLSAQLAGVGRDPDEDQRRARQLAGLLGRCLAGSLLVRAAPDLAPRYLAGLAEPVAAFGSQPGPGIDTALASVPET